MCVCARWVLRQRFTIDDNTEVCYILYCFKFSAIAVLRRGITGNRNLSCRTVAPTKQI